MEKKAFNLAETFVRRQIMRSGVLSDTNWPLLKVIDEPYVIWWDDETQLFEFPIFNVQTGGEAGYVLISPHRRLPPVLEYSTGNSRLSVQLFHYWRSKSLPPWTRLYYFSGTDIIARCHAKGDEDVFFRIPTLESVFMSRSTSIKRISEQIQHDKILSDQWESLDKVAEAPLGFQQIISQKQPIAYNQNCQSYRVNEEFKDGGNYCSPRCISGCSPVAWAMLASSWKKATWISGTERIYAGSTRWNIGWSSYDAGTSNPSMCYIVSDAIWRWHEKCDTSCEGFTSGGDVWDGHDLFEELWGLSWQWEKRDNPDFEDNRNVIDQAQPYLFSGQGNWNAYLAKIGKNEYRGKGGDGHTTVVWGYDTDPRKVLVCLGWGTNFGNQGSKWIDFDSISGRSQIWITRF